jgi:tetratricopeptide (TPR) repeat protein
MQSRVDGTYTASEVAGLLKLTEAQVQAFVAARLVQPALGEDGEARFSFRDLVQLKTLKGLVAAGVPEAELRPDAPPAPQSRETATRQGSFDFGLPGGPTWQQVQDAEGWFKLGCDLEGAQPLRAREAYRRAVALNPLHPDAHINLGRLLHVARDAVGAERHYRAALDARPRDATAAFNLGTALEDMGHSGDAIGAYARAIEADPGCADAYFNLARLYERAGRRAEAFRHLTAYKRLADQS